MSSDERRVRIMQDSDCFNPRKEHECNVGRMLCWHSRYSLGDEHKYDNGDWKYELACEHDAEVEDKIYEIENELADIWQDCACNDGGEENGYFYTANKVDKARQRVIDNAFNDGYIMMPLSLYDHSGISISTGAPSCSWDAGYVGVIVCDRKTIDEVFNGDEDKAFKALQIEVDIYDQYLRGDVWGYVAEMREKACCGECGREHDWVEVDSCGGFFGDNPMTNGMLYNLGDDWRDELENAVLE